MATLEGLVMAARSGDADAFTQLVQAEGQRAYRLAYGVLGSRPDAEDATQDAFIRAWRDLPRLNDAATWPGWFRSVTVHAALDRARRQQRHRVGDLADHAEVSTPDTTGWLADRADLMRAFRRLSAEDRALLTLRYSSDLPVPDVAAALGIPLGTAKSRLSRAIARMRETMENES
jgi:RNA polymerase sigma-70 factor (ECF subfamily)